MNAITPVVDMEKLARVWRAMQDRRDLLKAVYDKEDGVIEQQQEQVSAALLDAMNSMGGDSLKTAAGDIVRTLEYKPSASDWGAIYRFIKENDAFDLLHKRLGSTFVKEYAEKHGGDLPPGVSVFTGYKITVKKPKAKLPKEGSDV